MLGVRIDSGCLAKSAGVILSIRPIDTGKVSLVIRLQHILGGLGQPSVDEVAMGAVRRSASQLQRRRTIPAIRQGGTQIIPDAESELRHSLHAQRAAVLGAEGLRPVLDARIGRFEGGLVDAVVEEENRLEMGGAGFGRKFGGILAVGRALAAVVAEPLDSGEVLYAVLGGGRGVANDSFVVLGNGYFGLVDTDVVGAEAEDGSREGTGRVLVEKSGNPFAS